MGKLYERCAGDAENRWLFDSMRMETAVSLMGMILGIHMWLVTWLGTLLNQLPSA
jgi:hypothetical protein